MIECRLIDSRLLSMDCRRKALISFVACAVLVAGCGAPNNSSESAVEPIEKASTFVYDESAISNPTPWTSTDFNNNAYNFQFAIIGDRTGGANAAGTFNLAMDQLNLLHPEFVINVGDLIEGYTDDREELDAEWDELDGMLARLEMPFFRVTGNHDISSPITQQVYRERHGATYYHFVYNDVLFLALDSEDESRPEPPPGMKESLDLYNRLQVEDPEKAQEMLAEFMSDDAVIAALSKPVEFKQDQLDWIKNALAENAEVRWTFLFMHEPAWENPSESFKEIQVLLQERDFTWFAGHLHYYDYDEIDGDEYITMGPAGASFHHDGPGNVDHITWVTMTDDGPEIGNIALKGVFDRKGLDPSMFGAYDRKGGD